MITHIPDFFEAVDFKNSNTERFEGFLAFMKTTLNSSTDRNPSNEQAIREVFIRHHYRGVQSRYSGKYHHPLYSKIARHFSEFHQMSEVSILHTTDNECDVDSLLETLRTLGYTAYFYTLQNGRAMFNTLHAAQEVFSGMTPELVALRASVDEDSDDSSEDSEDEMIWDDIDEYEDLPDQ